MPLIHLALLETYTLREKTTLPETGLTEVTEAALYLEREGSGGLVLVSAKVMEVRVEKP